MSRPAGTQEKCIFPLADESTGGQVKHQAAIHLRVKSEVEVVQSLVRVAEGGLFAPAIQESLAAAGSSSLTRHEIRSIGAMASACAWRSLVSSTAAVPPSRSCRKARCNSMRFMVRSPGFCFE